MVLVELVSAGDENPVDISGERARAEQLVAANRLYRQTAVATGDAGIADLLDELERVLVDLAASPEQVSSDDLNDGASAHRVEEPALQSSCRVRRRPSAAEVNRSGESGQPLVAVEACRGILT